MSASNVPKLSLKLKLKIAVVSLLGFLLPSACMCYAPVLPPTTTPMCYEPTQMPSTPTPTTFTSPLPTPTPSPTPEARRLLRDKLLAEGRFPQKVARQLES
jgi:hypothetical protein